MIVVSVSGEDTVARGLGTLTARLADLSPAMRDLEQRVEDEATPLVPVLTGQLVDDLKGSADAQGMTWGSDLPYAGVQSGGWPAHGIEGTGYAEVAQRVVEAEAGDTVEDLLQTTARSVGLLG